MWVEYAQRLARRLQAENDAIRDQVIVAQRQCWDVLNRVERAASRPNLSPAFCGGQSRTIFRRRRRRHLLLQIGQPRADQRLFERKCRSHRYALREQLILVSSCSNRLAATRACFKPWMTVEYIQAWLDEAAARPNLENVCGWLIWGLGERCLPHEHPRLPPRPAAASDSLLHVARWKR